MVGWLRAQPRRHPPPRSDLMELAGWTVQDGVMADASGAPFTFDIRRSARARHSQAGRSPTYLCRRAWERLGINAKNQSPRSTVPPSCASAPRPSISTWLPYRARPSRSAPATSRSSTGAAKALADEVGSRNWMGVKSPGGRRDDRRDPDLGQQSGRVSSPPREALDRLLTAGRYVIPFWHSPRLALRPCQRAEKTRKRRRSTGTGSATCPMFGGSRSKHRHDPT